MKHKSNCLFVLLLLAVVSACSSTPGGGKCQGGLCVDVELAEPIGWNEPVPVTITVETEEDIPDLVVYLGFSDPDIVVVEGERKWVVDAKAQTPVRFSTAIRFPLREGYYDVIASAHDHRIGLVVRDYVPVRITALGGTLYPPPGEDIGWPSTLPLVFTLPPLTPSPLPATPASPLATPDKPGIPAPIMAGRMDLNTLIPDNGAWLTYILPITAAPPDAITVKVFVGFTIAHPRGQDLVAEVVGPDGVTVCRVWDRRMPVPDDFDERGLTLQVNVNDFNGLPVNGDWTFRVRDEVAGEAGALLDVSLGIGYIRLPPPSPTPVGGVHPPTRVPATPEPLDPIVAVGKDLNAAIPDDGAWLTYTVPLTTAWPDLLAVGGVSVKFLVDHPRGQDLIAEVVSPDGATVYRVWDRREPAPEDYEEGHLALRAYRLRVFDGWPINGDWTLRIRDEQPGEAGTLRGFTLAVHPWPASFFTTLTPDTRRYNLCVAIGYT